MAKYLANSIRQLCRDESSSKVVCILRFGSIVGYVVNPIITDLYMYISTCHFVCLACV